MSVQVQTWRTKPETVEAMQLTISNALEIARWSGGVVVCFTHGNDEVNVPTLRGTKRVVLGMYVVRDSEKRFWVMNENEFEGRFERMTNHG